MSNKPSNIIPDKSLQGFIATYDNVKKAWFLDISGVAVRVYTQGERPTNAKDKEFIEVAVNGNISTLTNLMDAPNGFLSLSIYISTNSGVINRIRHNYILQHIEDYVNRKKSTDNYYFEIETQNIMNLTNNFINGYSTQVLNIAWEKSN